MRTSKFTPEQMVHSLRQEDSAPADRRTAAASTISEQT